MIQKNLNRSYVMTVSLMAILFVFLTNAMVNAGGKGHTHDEDKINELEMPEEYKDKKNPYWSDLDAIIAGSKIYKEHCASCHGASGKGDGSLALDMNPKPFNFEDSRHMSQMNGGYLYWRTMEGGKLPPFRSAMPAYKNILAEEEVWQVLSYAHAFSHRHLLTHIKGEDLSMTEKKHYEGTEENKGHSH